MPFWTNVTTAIVCVRVS
uniref:Uncharacterized protein n=1 Tax=Anguilla anguilla TaxID=7936 RepID=A0A0E9WIE9_ANGAN